MNNSLQFSVVIPLYNKADTILRTLRSVEAQSFREFELIVVDDGSSDEGVSLVEPYKTTIPLRVIRQANAGVSAARNRGAAEAHGRYVVFLDADDEWMPTFLDELHRIVERFPAAKVIGTNYEQKNLDRIISGIDRDIREEVDFFAEWPYRSPVHTSSVAIRKDLFDRVGGFVVGHRYYEDAELLYKLALMTKFHLSRRVLCCYNTDAAIRATGTRHDVSEFPHWQLAERLLGDGVASPALKRCARLELEKYVLGCARHFRCGDVRRVKVSFPLSMEELGFFSWLGWCPVLVLCYPFVIGRSWVLRRRILKSFKVSNCKTR